MPEQNMSGSAAPTMSAKKDYSSLYLPLAIVLAGALIAVGLFFGLSGKNGVASAGNPPSVKAVNVKDVKTDGDPFIGKQDAPVTMAYWYDYQCPFCKAVDVGGIPQIPVTPAFPTLIKDYVNTGKLRIIFKDYPFLGNDSVTAAMYAHAVWDTYPDKFYVWHEAMFKAQDAEGDQGFGNEETILALVKKIPGLDAGKLKAVVAQNKDSYKKIMDANRAEGATFGIQGTPGFIIGTVKIDGAEDLKAFTAAIDGQLK